MNILSNMTGNIYLVGGGEIAQGETAPIDADVKKNTLNKSTLVFFGSAAEDALGYIETIERVYGDHFSIIVATKEKGVDFARKSIESSSAIYLGGGVTEKLLCLFDEWALVEDIKHAAASGKIIVGMSAGAQALTEWYIHEDGENMEIRSGWGIVPVCCLVHATEDSLEKAIAIHKNHSVASGRPLIGISEGVAMLYSANDPNKRPQQIGEGKIWVK